MAKQIDQHLVTPMVFFRFKNGFSEVDWAMPLDNPFPLTNLIQTMLEEAKAKHMAVFVQAALVNEEEFYGPAEPANPATPTDTGETDDGKAGQGSDSA